MILPGKNKPVDSDSLSRSLISLNKQYEENKKKLETIEKKLKDIKIVDFVLKDNMSAVTSNAVKNELDANYYNKSGVDERINNAIVSKDISSDCVLYTPFDKLTVIKHGKMITVNARTDPNTNINSNAYLLEIPFTLSQRTFGVAVANTNIGEFKAEQVYIETDGNIRLNASSDYVYNAVAFALTVLIN